MVIWNMAELDNKDRDFWEELMEWDVMVLMETWLDEKGWRAMGSKLPKGYRWRALNARRRNKRGRAMGRMLMEIRKELWQRGQGFEVSGRG